MSEDQHYKPLRPVKLPPDTRPAGQLGPVGNLAMLPVTSLVIDKRYQREIRQGGVANIVQIVEDFDWRRFGVVVVAAVGDGRYAVIDGQHRATAALLHPAVDLVPAYVVTADTATAASVFASLNGKRTAMTAGDLLHARAAAGEAMATELMALCRETGIVPLRAKSTVAGWKPGETMAVVALQSVFATHGPYVARAVFAALAHPRHAGAVKASAILALADIVAADKTWLHRKPGGVDLSGVLDGVRLADLLALAAGRAKAEGKPVRHVLRVSLEAALGVARRKAEAQPAETAEAA